MRDFKKVFDNVYRRELWGKGKGSGSGSSPKYSQVWLQYLRENIPAGANVLDIGCGDMQVWECDADLLESWNYRALEASEVAVGLAVKKYPKVLIELSPATPSTLKTLPKQDFVLLKDVMQHWTDDEIAENIDCLVECMPEATIIISNNWKYFRAPRDIVTRVLDKYVWAPVPPNHATLLKHGFKSVKTYPKGNFKLIMRRN